MKRLLGTIREGTNRRDRASANVNRSERSQRLVSVHQARP
jgi:hypothetical protein